MAGYRIAILYICTGKYDIFWKDFFKSTERFFLTNSVKEYFVFTDAEYLQGENECSRIHKIYQQRMGWPYDTLMRFELFSHIKHQLQKFDFIFFMNANLLCVKPISEKEFLPIEEQLLAVKHPGWINRSKLFYPYERNRKSTAFIPYGRGKYYYMGGLNGGKSEAYIILIETLKEAIQKDLDVGLIAKWHDESQLNRYLLNRDDVKILMPEYGYPEGWKLPDEAKILIRDKDKLINTSDIKGYKFWWVKVKKIIRKICCKKTR